MTLQPCYNCKPNRKRSVFRGKERNMNDFDDISMLQIGVFLTVADCKSITAAARKLYISQSAATRLMQKLEGCMNTTLLVRTNRGVELTENGARLYRMIKQLYSSMNAAFYDARSAQGSEAAVVRVACVEANEIFDEVTMLIKQFEKLYADVTVDLKICSFQELREGILSDAFDCVFTYSVSSKGLGNSETRYYKKFDTYFAVSANSPAIEGDRLNFAKLANSYIYVRPGERFDMTAKRDLSICASHGFSPKGIHYFMNEPAVASMVIEDNGFSIAGHGFGLRHGDSIRLFKTEQPIEEDQYMVLIWNPDRCSMVGKKFVESIPYIWAERGGAGG